MNTISQWTASKFIPGILTLSGVLAIVFLEIVHVARASVKDGNVIGIGNGNGIGNRKWKVKWYGSSRTLRYDTSRACSVCDSAA